MAPLPPKGEKSFVTFVLMCSKSMASSGWYGVVARNEFHPSQTQLRASCMIFREKSFHVTCRAVGTDLGTDAEIDSQTQSRLLLWVPGLLGDVAPDCIPMEVSNGIAYVILREDRFPWLFKQSGKILKIERCNQQNQSEETQVTIMFRNNEKPRPSSAFGTSVGKRPKPSSAPMSSGSSQKPSPTADPTEGDCAKTHVEKKGNQNSRAQTNRGDNPNPRSSFGIDTPGGRRPKPSCAPSSSASRQKPRPTAGPTKCDSAKTQEEKFGYQNTRRQKNPWTKATSGGRPTQPSGAPFRSASSQTPIPTVDLTKCDSTKTQEEEMGDQGTWRQQYLWKKAKLDDIQSQVNAATALLEAIKEQAGAQKKRKHKEKATMEEFEDVCASLQDPNPGKGGRVEAKCGAGSVEVDWARSSNASTKGGWDWWETYYYESGGWDWWESSWYKRANQKW